MSARFPHGLADFDGALLELRDEVLLMGSLANQNVNRSIRALLERDPELCKRVIAADSEVDEAERRIDRMGMNAIVRFHPVATDLRAILASMKISTNLERISDHSVGIAKRVRKILRTSELPEVTFAELLYGKASVLLNDAITAFADRNVTLGAGLEIRDKDLDRSFKRTTSNLTRRMGESPELLEPYLHLIFILRSLERIGDLAVNVGEDSVFMEAAKDIRHGHGLDEEYG